MWKRRPGMGIIDSNKFTVACVECGIEEDVVIHEKGSAFGTSWPVGPGLNHFDVQWNNDGLMGPVIEAATCKKCRTPSEVKS